MRSGCPCPRTSKYRSSPSVVTYPDCIGRHQKERLVWGFRSLVSLGWGPGGLPGPLAGRRSSTASTARPHAGLGTAFAVRTGYHHDIAIGIAEPDLPVAGCRADVRFF